jgi:F0F1-type ATP synthase delta subunit
MVDVMQQSFRQLFGVVKNVLQDKEQRLATLNRERQQLEQAWEQQNSILVEVSQEDTELTRLTQEVVECDEQVEEALKRFSIDLTSFIQSVSDARRLQLAFHPDKCRVADDFRATLASESDEKKAKVKSTVPLINKYKTFLEASIALDNSSDDPELARLADARCGIISQQIKLTQDDLAAKRSSSLGAAGQPRSQ